MKKSDVRENCLGSGTYFAWTMRGQRLRCPVCERMIQVTPGGKLRPHKPT
jgi:hypothetical protein